LCDFCAFCAFSRLSRRFCGNQAGSNQIRPDHFPHACGNCPKWDIPSGDAGLAFGRWRVVSATCALGSPDRTSQTQPNRMGLRIRIKIKIMIMKGGKGRRNRNKSSFRCISFGWQARLVTRAYNLLCRRLPAGDTAELNSAAQKRAVPPSFRCCRLPAGRVGCRFSYDVN
jgi:hypothetical protein